MTDVKPIVPQVCDRLKCKLDCCYGWDLCRQAREEMDRSEVFEWIDGLMRYWQIKKEERVSEK